ncbi:MAG: DUF4349 domain-containing protein [Gaiellaceae bacterium]
MSQRDLVGELRAARVGAPPELRDRVRALAAADTPERRWFTWRRLLVVAVPAAAAVAAAIVFTQPTTQQERTAQQQTVVHGEAGIVRGSRQADAATRQKAAGALAAPAPAGGGFAAAAPNRLQQVETTLSLRLPTADAVSSAMQRALAIAKSYGGYPVYVDAGSQGKLASADVTLKVPRSHLREAMTRLSALGTITAEHLDVQDLTAGVNETDRTIARLQRQLETLRAQQQTKLVRLKIARLTTSVTRLQRQKTATIRAAHYATVNLNLRTQHVSAQHKRGSGPLHGLGTTLLWLGIGAVYVLVLGTPIALVALLVWLAVRTVRRRREEALLGVQ